MSARTTLSAVLVTAALASACFHGRRTTLDTHMYAHFRQVGEIQVAVIEGVAASPVGKTAKG